MVVVGGGGWWCQGGGGANASVGSGGLGNRLNIHT